MPGDPDSQNRVDALVWALTDLLLTPKPQPTLYPRGDASRFVRAYPSG